MQIEAGKIYRARNGSKFGPMQPAQSDGYDFYGSDGGIDRVFQKNGKHGGSYIKPDPELDLVAEWTDGPVRTVTRTVTEIVPGEYSYVEVGEIEGKERVQVAIGPCAGLIPMTATELKAAAAVLLELAGALPDGE